MLLPFAGHAQQLTPTTQFGQIPPRISRILDYDLLGTLLRAARLAVAAYLGL
jgi:hypothetical protein